MLEVISLENARKIVQESFMGFNTETEVIPCDQALGRILAEDIVSREGVPPFDRSTVDGFALQAADTFGCSDALPALLTLIGQVEMGEQYATDCTPGTCIRIPTGGQVPPGANAVVMLEYCEEYGDGTVGIASAVAPGSNIVFENDDVSPGETLIGSGTRILPHHIGTLASLGITSCAVRTQPTVGIISTGDEIVAVDQVLVASQMRDVNTPALAAAVCACGAIPRIYPIVPDIYEALCRTVNDALTSCDILLVSGGSSAGQKDNTARVLQDVGDLLFHGIAVKPGKPTLYALSNSTPLFGLPGHPLAAYFMFLELVAPLLAPQLQKTLQVPATLSQGIPSNHGRSELVPVQLDSSVDESLGDNSLRAVPIRSKSGLISQLCSAWGYIEIDRDTEGLAAGSTVFVKPFM